MQSDNGRDGRHENSQVSKEVGLSPKSTFDLHYDAWGRLVLIDAAGRGHVGVEPIRGFPISNPHHGISICDAEGHELVWIDNPDELPAPVRGVLAESLARREFLPVLLRIVKISTLVEPSEWDVETDRGRARFILNNEDDIRRLDDHRAVVIDANGIRYLIPDIRSLDPASRRFLKRYL